jgi:hypothetical protein
MDAAPEETVARPATAARVYDYLLGGVHNFPADREVAQKLLAGMPVARNAARANREFLGRAVRYLAGQGIDQYLDLGSGIPTEGNVHEILQQVRPQARVVYVDIDPLAVAESLELLDGNPNTAAIRGDVRDPGPVLAHPELRRLIDLSQPVALLLMAVMHFVPDDTVAYPAVAQLRDALAPGSWLAGTHGATEVSPTDRRPEIGQAYEQKTTTGFAKPRTQDEFARFYADWEMVEPGLVWVSQWRPDPAAPVEDPTLSAGWAAVARKPA